MKLVMDTAKQVTKEERASFIAEHGVYAYEMSTWFTIHQLLGSGAQVKDDFQGRKHEPWNASFWYA
jgi:hypothetical protein